MAAHYVTRVEANPDPVLAAFMDFLADDIVAAPRRIQPLNATRINKARALTKGITVDNDETLPGDVTL